MSIVIYPLALGLAVVGLELLRMAYVTRNVPPVECHPHIAAALGSAGLLVAVLLPWCRP